MCKYMAGDHRKAMKIEQFQQKWQKCKKKHTQFESSTPYNDMSHLLLFRCLEKIGGSWITF